MKLTFEQIKSLCIAECKHTIKNITNDDNLIEEHLSYLSKTNNLYDLLVCIGELGYEDPEIFVLSSIMEDDEVAK